MSDIMGRLASMGSIAPEVAMEMLALIIDAVGTGAEWSGENLDRLGEMTQQLADKIRGAEGEKK